MILLHRLHWTPVFLPVVVLALAVAAACGSVQEPLPMAKDFQVTLFDGSEFHLSEQIGKNVVVLNFWYPSCPPCREEMPAFQEAWQRFEDKDVLFLGVFVPQGFDSEQDARDFVQETGLTYHFATDKMARIALEYRLEYFPKTYFIDRSGRIFLDMISALDADEITDVVRAMRQG